MEVFCDGVGFDVDIFFDLNFNVKIEGLFKIVCEFEDFDLFWIEIDMLSFEVLVIVCCNSCYLISFCEMLFGMYVFVFYFCE